MSYTLQVKPIESGRLAEALGAGQLELHELNVGMLRRLMVQSSGMSDYGYLVLGASLFADGQPVGLKRIDELPGHLSSHIGHLILEVYTLHGLGESSEPDEAASDPPAPNGLDSPFRPESGGSHAVRPGA